MNKKFFALTLMAVAAAIGYGAERDETFESYAIGDQWTAFQGSGASATVVANPAGDGLSLYVTNTNYNSVPQYDFTLPEGTTLADCTAVGFNLYVSSSDYNENGGNVYKQLHIYLNGQRVYKSTNSSGDDAYPNLAKTNTWTRISISLDELTLTDAQRGLSQFSLAMGINDKKIKYYVDNAFVKYTVVQAGPTLPAEGAYASGIYRNLFKEAGHTDAEIEAKVNDLWNKLFYGDDDERIYYPVGTDMAYILDVNNNDVRTEGQSYGMMLCVQMDKQAEFDRLWKWAKTYMQYGDDAEQAGYFAWQVEPNGTIKGRTPASDGEEYFITALYFAAGRWGNGQGIYDYQAEADKIVEACFNKPMTAINPHSSYTNLFDMNEQQVVFVPYASAAKFTDPSYHLPAFYEAISKVAATHRDDFRKLAAKSRQMWSKFANPTTGLMPDYADFDGSAHQGDGDHAKFLYDAWRVMMNMGVDYSWFKPEGIDYTSLVGKPLNFFATVANGVENYKNGYTLDGASISGMSDHSPGLVGSNATACLAYDQPLAWDFIEDFWNISMTKGKYRYYDGCLQMMNMLICSGNFRIYLPEVDFDDPIDDPTVDDPTVDDGDIIVNPGLSEADGANYVDGWLIVEDFEGVTLGTTYDFCDHSGNVAAGKGNAEVVEIAGTQAVKAVWATNYEDYGTKLVFTLPRDITEYSSISFDLMRDAANDYKPLTLYINGTVIVDGENNGMPTKKDTWATKTYSLEGKGLEATNELLFVLHSRVSANWTLYIDNIRLQPKYEIPTGPAENAAIVLTDDNDYAFTEEYEVPSVTYTRTVSHNDWHAICLPFAVTDWSTFADDVIELTGVTEVDGNVALEFSHVAPGALAAGKPYIFKPSADAVDITEEEATITPNITPATAGAYTLTGAYATTSMAGNYALKDGTFYKGSAVASLKPFRAYITTNAAQGTPAKLAVKIDGEVESGIQAVIGDNDGDTVIYNLQGVRVDRPTRGIYIRGGRKIIVK